MSKKSVYFYKVTITERETGRELPVREYRDLFCDILSREGANGTVNLTFHQQEPVWMDVVENTEHHLFSRLSRKRLNNSLQKRNYQSGRVAEVLAPDERANSGVECFTYCLLFYECGVLAIANAKGAPHDEAFTMMFALYQKGYTLETAAIPSHDMVQELLHGRAPQINRIHVDIAMPGAQLLSEVFGFADEEVIAAMGRKTAGLAIDVKPDFRDHLIAEPDLITRLIGLLRNTQGRYNNIKITGKRDGEHGQREYDLYEEYFKYQIDIREYRQENGRRVEASRSRIQREYKEKMMEVYAHYRTEILAFADRLIVAGEI